MLVPGQSIGLVLLSFILSEGGEICVHYKSVQHCFTFY